MAYAVPLSGEDGMGAYGQGAAVNQNFREESGGICS